MKKSSPKKMVTKTTKPVARKVVVGEDEFCPTCMEWRSYDERGRCKVCGHIIKKIAGEGKKITDEYDLKDFADDHEEQPDSSEF
jgi:hypothetical protein